MYSSTRFLQQVLIGDIYSSTRSPIQYNSLDTYSRAQQGTCIVCTVQFSQQFLFAFFFKSTDIQTDKWGIYIYTPPCILSHIMSVQYILSNATQMFRGFDQDIMDTLYFLTFKHLCVEGNNKREINIYSLFLCDRSGDRSDGLYHSKPFQ